MVNSYGETSINFLRDEQAQYPIESLIRSIMLNYCQENKDKLKKHVQTLRDQGGTALGPAVGMACVIAKHRNVH